MTESASFIMAFFAVNLLLAILLVGLIWYVFKRAKHVSSLEKRMLREKEEMLKKAQQEASTLIDDAISSSDKIIESAETTNRKIEEQMANLEKKSVQSLEDKNSHAQAYFDEVLESLKQQYAKEMTNAGGTISEVAKKETESLKESIRLEIENAQKRIAEHETNEKNRVSREIEEYKNEEIQKAHEAISGVIESISEEVFGKALSREQYDQLIIEALEKARSEHIL